MLTVSETRLDVQPTLHLLAANGQPLTLPEAIDDEARAFRERGDNLGRFLADQLDRLAQLVRWTGAETQDQHEERMEIYDDELRTKHYDRGYEDGLEAARNEYGLSLE